MTIYGVMGEHALTGESVRERGDSSTALGMTGRNVDSARNDKEHGIVLFYGDAGVHQIGMAMAAEAVSETAHAYLVDGANGFNSYFLTRLALKRGLPAALVQRHVHISRAFTCHQFVSGLGLLERMIHEGRVAFAGLLGPASTFLDADVRDDEVKFQFEKAGRILRRLGALGVPLVMSQPSFTSANGRDFLLPDLKALAGAVYRVSVTADGALEPVEEPKYRTRHAWPLQNK